MEVTIRVSEMDADRISVLGSLPWLRITEEQKQEFERLLRLMGSAVCMVIMNKK